MIFDTHAHYSDEQFDKDRDELLWGMEDEGVGTIVEIGASMESSREAIRPVSYTHLTLPTILLV